MSGEYSCNSLTGNYCKSAEKLAAVSFAFILVFSLPTQQAMAQEDGEGQENMHYQEAMGHHADKDVGYGSEASFLTWHGYINFEFDAQQEKNTNFDSHEFYLSTQSEISERLTLTAEFEYEHAPEKLILPIQAYADFKIHENLTFRAGNFFTPMGISRSYNLRGNKNRLIRQVALTHDIMFENWAETGLNVFGEFDFGVFYDVAIGNGMPNTMGTGDSWFDAKQDLQNHSEDNNDNKAIHSRVGYHSSDLMGELNIGASFGTQKYDPDGEKEMTHIGGDLRYLHESGLRIQAEVMTRSGDSNEENLKKGIAADALGWYAQVSKRFVFEDPSWLHYLEPVVQIDFIDLNTDVDDNKDKLTTAIGLIYSPEPYYLVKVGYDIVSERSGDSVDNNKFWGAIVVEF